MKPVFNSELFDRVFVVRNNNNSPNANNSAQPSNTAKPVYTSQPVKEKKTGEYCGIKEFVKVICSTYGAGNMDTFFDRDSPSWLQVWFTADEVVQQARSKGYSLTLLQAKEYLARLLSDKNRLIEERQNIERGIEYRRVRLMFNYRKNCIENI